MATYDIASDVLRDSVREVLEEFHPHLRDAEVAIDVLLAYAPRDANSDPNGPAIKVHGHGCAAVVRIIGLKDRVAGRGDAEIVIDGDRCDTWSEDTLRAVIDHELTHLVLKVSDKGIIRRDDANRPLLRMRQHDRQFGWFDCIARRHGHHSVEVQQAIQLTETAEIKQLYFPGMEAATTGKRKRA